MLAIPVAFLSFPALTALGCTACAAKLFFLSDDPVGGAARSPLSLLLVRLSLKRSGDRNAQLQAPDRDRLDRPARVRFIEEFEQAGRGWFWETTARGALSYVSEQLAADLEDPRRAS